MLRKYINSVQEIEKLYDFLNEHFFESALSKPVITIQPNEKNHALGWFIPYRIWKGSDGYSDCELNLSANFLDRNVEDIAATLLHEMCHQYAFNNGIKDTCRRGHYHNQRFAQIAKAHGLEIEKVKDGGFTATRLSEDAKKIIQGIDITGKVIYRKTEQMANLLNGRKPSSTRKYIC